MVQLVQEEHREVLVGGAALRYEVRVEQQARAAATLDPADAWLLEVMWAAWEEDFCFEPAELVAFGRLLVRTFREPRSAA